MLLDRGDRFTKPGEVGERDPGGAGCKYDCPPCGGEVRLAELDRLWCAVDGAEGG